MSEVGTGTSRILIDAGEGKAGVLQARQYCHEIISQNGSIEGACTRNPRSVPCVRAVLSVA